MSRQDNAAPVIIKRKKVVAGGGHHGGAWKVAYADFVTAMMAFFLMMWLLGATTESQRRGLADYFNPTIPIHRIASGGDAMLGGNDLETREQTGPASPDSATPDNAGSGPQAESFAELRERLEGLGGESALMAQALRHVVTRLTDEGLVIEIFDLPDAPLFETDTDTPRPVLRILARILAEVSGLAANPLAIEGHVRSYPVVRAVDPGWPLSIARAARLREMLEAEGLDPTRVARVTGHADRRPAAENPMSARNNRLGVILLRETQRR
jgi:chemotaxis protein MotB